MKKDIKRNRKNENLAGLYAVPHDIAYANGKLRNGVFGLVDKTTCFVSNPANYSKNKPRTFKKDVHKLPTACKNRILAFWDDKNNAKKEVCYLAEKRLYEEMKNKEKKK